MNREPEVVIIGSGPAGVSAAFPILDSGKRVLMIDGGKEPEIAPPSDHYLTERNRRHSQQQWMVGKDFQALKNRDFASPKLRTPTQSYAFEDFLAVNKIVSRDFVAIGSLAVGGLSNTWGCGVARFADNLLESFPCGIHEMDLSYKVVAERIGISGATSRDDLSEYFGLDDWSEGSIELDPLNQDLYQRYEKQRTGINRLGVRFGCSRKAVLAVDRLARRACNLSGNCAWGCSRGSLYSSVHDLAALKTYQNFEHKPGLLVERITRNEKFWAIQTRDSSSGHVRLIKASKVLLAAGTLATTRLAMNVLGFKGSRPLLSCPSATFLACLPHRLGKPVEQGFGLGQISYVIEVGEGFNGFGSTFSPVGIAVSEFVRRLPFTTRNSVRLMRGLISSCVIGNVFLPGSLSDAKVRIDDEGCLQIAGGYSSSVPELMRKAHRKLSKSFLRMGAIILPFSFTVAAPGSDNHYAGTLPMSNSPMIGETHQNGELEGTRNLYVVDGASLPILSEQSHTLTIMANADRIGRLIAARSSLLPQ